MPKAEYDDLSDKTKAYSAWVSALLVQLLRAMQEPLRAGRVTITDSRASFYAHDSNYYQHISSGIAVAQHNMDFYYMGCKAIVDYIIPILGFIVSTVACLYTIKTYKKSHSILEVIEKEKIWTWNKKELEHLFSYISIDCLDSFFSDPSIIHKELWWGLKWVDLNTFQFNGKEKEFIIKFIKDLDSFRDLNYKQTPSKHWKFEPLSEKEPYDEEKELQEIRKLFSKASTLRPLYDEILKVLLEYQVDLREMSTRAYDKFIDSTREN